MQSILLLALSFCAAPPDVAAEEAEIRKFLSTREAAFEREDAQWLTGHFTEEGELINSSGLHVKGRKAIEKTYRELFARPHHKEVQTTHTIDEIRCVTPDVAVVDAGWALHNLKDESGKPLPDRQGRTLIVVVKKGDEWMIDLLRADLKIHAALEPEGKDDPK